MGAQAAFDATAFAGWLAELLDVPIPAAIPRVGASAAYLCTRGSSDLRDVIRPLSYRFDRVFVLATDPVDVDRWSNVEGFDWRNDTASFHDELETTNMASAFGVPPDWDLPAKRTVALEHARQNRFGVGLLIDDDIRFLGGEDLSLFRSLENALLGRPPRSCPDLSVLEEMFESDAPHAFPNGNYLFFDPARPTGFFPKMYNDDWFFVWSSRDCRPTVLASGFLTHGARAFAPEKRAAQQEIGETLIKGLCSPQPDILAVAFWQAIMSERQRYVSSLRTVATTPMSHRVAGAALAMHNMIDASDLSQWCSAFLNDNRKWRTRLETR